MVHRSESELNFDNVLFKERNKAYGAYYLRGVYNNHLRVAIVIAALFFTTALVSPLVIEKINKLLGKTEKQEEDFKIQEVILTEPPPIDPKTTPPPPPPKIEYASAPKVSSTKFLPPKIVEDEKVVEEEAPPTQEEMKDSNPGEETVKGDSENLNEVIVGAGGTGNAVVGEVENNEIMTHVSEPTSFQGDYVAFLKKNLVYPPRANRERKQGKVNIKFVVEKDGSITNITLVNKLGFGLDEEALRVVNLTKGKWTVGKNNGIPVRVWKYLAIEFRLPPEEVDEE